MIVAAQHSYGWFNLNANQIIHLVVLETAAEYLLRLSFGEVIAWGIRLYRMMSLHVPGVDPAFRNEYQDIPGGKDGRCIGLTTLPR
jgi:hypothetical protein